jgi:Na+-driven multidrug efflux pump
MTTQIEPLTSPAAAAGDARLWPLVREALRGSRRDLTAVPLARAVVLLAIPMVLEMVMESVFAVTDIFWVSKLGADAVAAVGLTETLETVVYAIAMGLAMGVGALVARRTGEKNADGAARAAVQAIVIGLVFAVVVGAAGSAVAPRLLAVMGASPSVQAIGAGYARVMLGGTVTVVLLANGINILLGPVLVFGLGPAPRLGVTGAAIATTIGRGIGVVYQVRALARGRGRLRVTRAHLALDREALGTILRVAKSGIVQSLIGMTSWIGLVRIVSAFGSAALAGYTIAIRVVLFALLPSWGLGNAAATLVGQNLGAGQPARAEQAVWRAALYNLVFLGLVGLAFVLLGPEIVRLFTADPVVVGEGGRCLRIVAAGFPFYAYGMVVSQAFNGAGDTDTPTRINLICFWLFEIPFAFVLARSFGTGPTGAYVAIAAAFSAMAVLSVVIFRRGEWKSVVV